MRILCFGDSNTYGYDPRGFVAGRYDKNHRWPDILGALTGHEVFNDSMHGRKIPRWDIELKLFRDTLLRTQPDMLIIMLGTNDVVTGASAVETKERMEAFLGQIPPELELVILAPPPIRKGVWVEDEHIIAEAGLLGELYRELAAKWGAVYLDCRELPLSHDGVHLSEDGHAMLANKLYEKLKSRR